MKISICEVIWSKDTMTLSPTFEGAWFSEAEVKTDQLILLKALCFSGLCLRLSFLPSTFHFPPWGSQQGETLNHFVLYQEKLSDRSFCGLHKSVSFHYRAQNALCLSCWLCKSWTVTALAGKRQSRSSPGDKSSFYFQEKCLHEAFLHFIISWK